MGAFCVGQTCVELDRLPTEEALRAAEEEERRRVASTELLQQITATRAPQLLTRATPRAGPRPLY